MFVRLFPHKIDATFGIKCGSDVLLVGYELSIHSSAWTHQQVEW